MSNNIVKVSNPMMSTGTSNQVFKPSENQQTAIAASAEIARVQGQLVAAKNFPRDERASVDRTLNAFRRKSLAEVGMYQYAKGGQNINDLSIRAAETMAQYWGNMDFGLREMESKNAESTVEAYAWDLETNTRRSIVFHVPHFRDTKQGRKKLEDSRDIYELVANQGARRVRACILAIIPRDIQDAVKEQITETLSANVDISPERIKSMLGKFSEMGVTKEMIESLIQRRIDTIEPAQMIRLGNIYNSIRDGMSAPSDWFTVVPQGQNGADGKKTLAGMARQSIAAAPVETPVVNAEVPSPQQNIDDAGQLHPAPAPAANQNTRATDEELAKALESAPVTISEIKDWCRKNGVPYNPAEIMANLPHVVNQVLDGMNSEF